MAIIPLLEKRISSPLYSFKVHVQVNYYPPNLRRRFD